jgi:hypothetical protein
MMSNWKACWLSCVCVAGWCSTAHAVNVAYWRFEDKNGLPAIPGDSLRSTPTPGGTTSGGNIVDITSDTSGNSNELRTFHSPNDPTSPDGAQRLDTSPEYTLDTPALVIPQTGAPNLLAFDFDRTPGTAQQPPGTLPNDAGPDDIFSLDNENVAGPINSMVLNQYTIEGAFKIDTLNRFQSILVKDGNVGGGGGVGPGPLPPMNVKLFADNTFNIETFDGAGAFHKITANDLAVANQWYKFAVVNDGATLSLYLDSSDGNGYVLQNQQAAVSGGLFNNNSVWAVGRGWFNGVNDFFDGQIDEVRISDVALGRGEFLFVPEPSAAMLGLLAVVGCGSLTKRRGRE